MIIFEELFDDEYLLQTFLDTLLLEMIITLEMIMGIVVLGLIKMYGIYEIIFDFFIIVLLLDEHIQAYTKMILVVHVKFHGVIES
ncbi:MAG: hypothetical protein LBC61_07720 [Candidatus Peribacteria bacterium]|nr:hypothetical protein [Candidatus Peribacteria bacterium]